MPGVREGEDLVEQIDQAFQARGVRIVRDKRDLGYQGSISEFMEQHRPRQLCDRGRSATNTCAPPIACSSWWRSQTGNSSMTGSSRGPEDAEYL